MHERGSMPLHAQIFDYWKDKYIMPDGSVVTENDLNKNDKSIPVVYDWGEPECWCCGKWVNVKEMDLLEGASEEDEDRIIRKIWNGTKNRLQRCHIIPRMKGGTNEPSNLFLMCSKCHEESPDIADNKSLLRYVYGRRVNGNSTIEKFIRACTCDVDEVLKQCGYEGRMEILENYVENNNGLLDAQTLLEAETKDEMDKIGVHATSVPNSTWTGALANAWISLSKSIS